MKHALCKNNAELQDLRIISASGGRNLSKSATIFRKTRETAHRSLWAWQELACRRRRISTAKGSQKSAVVVFSFQDADAQSVRFRPACSAALPRERPNGARKWHRTFQNALLQQSPAFLRAPSQRVPQVARVALSRVVSPDETGGPSPALLTMAVSGREGSRSGGVSGAGPRS